MHRNVKAAPPPYTTETCVDRSGTHETVGFQLKPFRSPPERPAHCLPLDRIHENGHPDIARFTTEEFKEFHEYLTKSTKDGRSFRGSGKIDIEDIANIQEKAKEGLKTKSSETLLNTLLSLCKLSNVRDKNCVDFFTEEVFNELFTDILAEVRRRDANVNDQINHPGCYIGFNLLIDAAQRVTENNPELCRKMGKMVVPLILDTVSDPFFDVEALNRDDEELKWMSRRELLKKMFTLLFNCIRNHPDNRDVFRRGMASKLLKPFLDCRFYILRAKALFILAYIVTEEENIDLNTTSLNIEFIVKVLRSALADPSHYSAHYNFFAVEVVEAVQRIAANDDNKDKFIEAGVLPHLATMIDENNSKEERNTAFNALWVLSFTSNNKVAILNEKGCIDNLYACLDVDDYNRACRGILWNLHKQVIARPEAKKDEDKEEKGGDDNGSNHGSTASERAHPELKRKVTPNLQKSPHVMISYEWGVQKQILKVKDALKALGFNVWMDVERMEGSILEAMAKAVEEACVVIICFSEKYKDSPHCRTEAEYTYKLRKDIIPLKMQASYDPNSWLGAILANKIYIQMNTLALVQQNIGHLVRVLADRGRYPSDEDQDKMSSPPTKRSARSGSLDFSGHGKTLPSSPPHELQPLVLESEGATCVQIVQKWDSGEVVNWLNRNNYSHRKDWFLGYNGEDLLGLKKIAAQAPDFFFGKLARDFGFKSLLEMIRFKKMLDDII